MSDDEPTSWDEIDPKDAVNLDLSTDLSIDAPLNEAGERCPWPWEPEQLVGVAMGQYHCGYCGAMVIAGIPHLDYRPLLEDVTRDAHLDVPDIRVRHATSGAFYEDLRGQAVGWLRDFVTLDGLRAFVHFCPCLRDGHWTIWIDVNGVSEEPQP